MHRRGQRQPSKDRDLQADQAVTPELRNVWASTSQPVQQVRWGQSKAHARHENVWGNRAREQTGDPVEGGEAVARPITPFKVDAHRSWMIKYELALIRRHYQVPNYVQFRLPRPVDVPTKLPSGRVAVYRDYFIRGIRLPLHLFIREVLLNLEISLPQLNPNAY